jgi:UDP-3-O-[3-hydroxymyristoyl] glucosamine N-acyltransferase
VLKTVSELAQLVSAQVEGDASLQVSGVSSLEAAQPGQLSFYGNRRYKQALTATRASVILVPLEHPSAHPATLLKVANPHLAFARIAQVFSPEQTYVPGVSPRANVDPTARVAASATVMAGATVGALAVVGERAVLYPGVYLGASTAVGADTVLMPNVTVLDRCTIGARCLLHPSVVIGADGFGFALDLTVPEHVKIPQAGTVRVEDDVEIGACSCVDRATTGETVIAHGAKLDNLVQVGHNSTVGPLSILCAQVGLSGSSELGTGVVLAGQVGVGGHLRIGDLAKVAGQSGIMGDVPDGANVMGAPAIPYRDFMRSWALFGRLPELQAQLREMKKRLEQLEHPTKP